MKSLAELRREAHDATEHLLEVHAGDGPAGPFEDGANVVCEQSHECWNRQECAIDALADRAEAAESDLSRTTQLWKRALEDLNAAESRIANEIAARQRAQEHGIGDRARIEELERERDAARRHAHRWWGTGDVCQCCGEKYPLSMKEPR